MKSIGISRPGGPEVLEMMEKPMPEPGNGELLIQVHAAGVNRPDVYQRKGNYPPPPGASLDIPGLEIAGIVVKLGKDTQRYKPGDAVCCLVTGGGYAEYCTAPEGQCLPVPSGLNMVEAASLPETIFTVWSNVFQRGKLKQHESLLVHGGSSGIGVAAIQCAKAFGAKVYVTAGSDDKCVFCEKLGADKAINYKTSPFKDAIKALGGVDVILDMVGGDYTNDNLEVLKEEGRLVLINTMNGDQVNIKLGMIMRKRLTLTGSSLRARDIAFKSALAREVEKYVWPWIHSKKVLPVIDSIFPMAEASLAHRKMEASTHMGKVVLTW